jgi:hypothetical protein
MIFLYCSFFVFVDSVGPGATMITQRRQEGLIWGSVSGRQQLEVLVSGATIVSAAKGFGWRTFAWAFAMESIWDIWDILIHI